MRQRAYLRQLSTSSAVNPSGVVAAVRATDLPLDPDAPGVAGPTTHDTAFWNSDSETVCATPEYESYSVITFDPPCGGVPLSDRACEPEVTTGSHTGLRELTLYPSFKSPEYTTYELPP